MADELATEQETLEDIQPSDEQLALEAAEATDVFALQEDSLAEDDIAPAQESQELAELVELAEREALDGSEEQSGQQIIVDVDEEPEKEPSPLGTKVAGAAKMVGGAALAAAAVPLVVVPIAPTSLMAVGGVTLAAKGQREFSGREISQLEVKAEAATEKITKVTKKTTGGLLSRLGEASTRAAEKLSETDWDEKLGLNDE